MVNYLITFDELLECARKMQYTSYEAKIVKRKWVITFHNEQEMPQYRLGESLSRIQQELLVQVLDIYQLESTACDKA